MEAYLAESYQEVFELVSEIKHSHFENKEIWFRGQGSSQYMLKPSLLRTKNGIDKEKEVFSEFKRLSTNIGVGYTNEWNALVDMQHYGIPTRLLDWTNNLGVALYFAASSSVRYSSMSLYIMNPIELNKLSGKKGIPVLPNDTMGLSYIQNYVDREPFPARYPIAAKCDSINQRVKAQSGMFTIHGDEENEEDIIATILDKKSAIYRIDISTEALPSLNDYFDICGIKDYTIFPDIQGIASHLRGIL